MEQVVSYDNFFSYPPSLGGEYSKDQTYNAGIFSLEKDLVFRAELTCVEGDFFKPSVFEPSEYGIILFLRCNGCPDRRLYFTRNIENDIINLFQHGFPPTSKKVYNKKSLDNRLVKLRGNNEFKILFIDGKWDFSINGRNIVEGYDALGPVQECNLGVFVDKTNVVKTVHYEVWN
ncbi:MAG: hypothetical protein ABJD58_09335 [Cyclobacteriaceae bacterium]